MTWIAHSHHHSRTVEILCGEKPHDDVALIGLRRGHHEASPLYARYDPHMVVERHSHRSHHIVFVLEGEITVGDVCCTAGMHITLEHGAVFGPIVAGPDGAILYEIMMGDPRAVPADREGFERLCAERGVEPLPNPPLDRPDWVGERTD